MSESLKKILPAIIALLKTLAGLSETTVDDKVVEVLEKILASDLLTDWLVSNVIDDDFAGSITPNIASELDASVNSVDVLSLLEYAVPLLRYIAVTFFKFDFDE